MKRLIILFLILPALSKSQETIHGLQVVENKVNYMEIVQVDSMAKNQLFLRAKKYIVDNFTSGKDVIQIDDKEMGELVGKGFTEMMWNYYGKREMPVKIWYQMKFSIKNDKYRIQLTDVAIAVSNSPEIGIIEWYNNYANQKGFLGIKIKNADQVLQSADTYFRETLERIKQSMRKNKTDNW